MTGAAHFKATNEWEVAVTDENVTWVIGPTGTIMNSIQASGMDALREYISDGESGVWTASSSDVHTLARHLSYKDLGKKVRVRTSATVIIEDELVGVYHFTGVVRLYFKNTKAYPGLFSQDEGYRVDLDEPVKVIE